MSAYDAYFAGTMVDSTLSGASIAANLEGIRDSPQTTA
jgi:hypothetical protein